ncbi:DNA polymerase alpha/epsilon subunit B-domain-containing protein [Amanita rubescens]|nr:DNA polymerase alpha/epsilon subunit B-domain-containing protein [Amanita rubescens]
MSTAGDLKQGLISTFGDVVASDNDLMQQCISVCQLYNLPPEDLLWKWEAIRFKPNSLLSASENPTFNMESIAAIKGQLTRELKEGSKRKPQVRPNQFVFPANLQRSRFTSRSHVVKTEPSDVHLSGSAAVDFRGPRTDEASKKRRAYRYMYEKITERSEVLDDRIDELAELVRDHYAMADLGDPSASTDKTEASKLTEAAVWLESSRILGSGSRIPLRFDPGIKIRGCIKGAGGLGLFPGAIVALKGRNGGGGWFQVSEVLGLPPPRPAPPFGPSTSKIDSTSSFTMDIACGPYTLDTDLQYAPLKLFFEQIRATKPNVVLLMGPFVDLSHPRIKIGDFDSSPSTIYEARFLNPLKSFLEASPESIVLLLPSVRDLLSDHAVYPQSEHPEELTGGHPRIRLLPNPARFTINGISFGVTSVDVLFHLKREEFVKRGEEADPISPTSAEDTGSDVMGNLCRHLLQQRSFYPLFPVPTDVSHEVNLDISHSDGLRMTNADNTYAPDVLIVPSKLKEFSKMVHSTRAINPSYINKAKYAKLHVSSGEMPGKDRVGATLAKLEA